MSDEMDYEKTYELFDLAAYSCIDETTDHQIFLCPFCETKRGKPDKEGKFYWSRDKDIGWCHKCHTVGFPEKDPETDHSQVELDRTIEATTNRLNGVNFIHPPAIGFSFNDPSIQHLEYLRSRHALLPPLARLLGVKGWSGSNTGVVFPFIYRNYVARFQVRFDTDDKAKRYYTSPGEHKILYSPTHLLSDFRLRNEETVTIVEGVFDAIAALILGYPNPVAILGSSMTDYNAYLIRKLVPEKAIIFMDTRELNYSITQSLKERCPSLSEINTVNFGDDIDPEEVLKNEMKDPVKFKEYATNVAGLISMYK